MRTNQTWDTRGRDQGPRPTRFAILAIVIVVGATVGARVARADEQGETAAAWGVATFDVLAPLSLGAIHLWGPESMQPSKYVVSGLGAFAAGVAVASIGEGQEWEPTIPLATHGAIWGGLDGFLVGGLLDGVMQGREFAPGPLAFGLAGAGALATGWVGATAVEPGEATVTWLVAPAIGAATGLMLSVVPVIALKYQGRDDTAHRLAGWFIASGIALGLFAGAVTEAEPAAETASAYQPRSFMLPLAWHF